MGWLPEFITRMHWAITQKPPIILGSPTYPSTDTPNFLVNVSSHSFLLSINTDSAISTSEVALAIYRQCHLNRPRGPRNFDEGHRINKGGANTTPGKCRKM